MAAYCLSVGFGELKTPKWNWSRTLPPLKAPQLSVRNLPACNPANMFWFWSYQNLQWPTSFVIPQCLLKFVYLLILSHSCRTSSCPDISMCASAGCSFLLSHKTFIHLNLIIITQLPYSDRLCSVHAKAELRCVYINSVLVSSYLLDCWSTRLTPQVLCIQSANMCNHSKAHLLTCWSFKTAQASLLHSLNLQCPLGFGGVKAADQRKGHKTQ